MNFFVKEITDKKIWENFLLDCQEKTFLNSWNWGEFNERMGNKIWRFGIFSTSGIQFKEPNLVSLALVIKIVAKRGKFLFVPHGPNIKQKTKEEKSKILKALLEKLREIGKEEKCDFIRIAPILENIEENKKIFKEFNFKEGPIHIHPELTWELNIKKSENDLLKEMRKTTRYLIRQAIKNKEIKIEEMNSFDGIKKFNQVYKLTKERHGFVPFSLDYLKNEFLVFSKENQISVLLGKYKEEIVSGGVFIFWQKIGFYHHGASSQKYPKIPVSYLLLWEAIKKAKEKGCERFNFWGICDLNQKKHPWYGLSLFKVGFGGEKKEYLRTQDLPISSKYWLNYLIETIRKIKRRY